MTDEQAEKLRALLAPLVAVVAASPLTDSDDKRELMALWYEFNEAILAKERK